MTKESLTSHLGEIPSHLIWNLLNSVLLLFIRCEPETEKWGTSMVFVLCTCTHLSQLDRLKSMGVKSKYFWSHLSTHYLCQFSVLSFLHDVKRGRIVLCTLSKCGTDEDSALYVLQWDSCIVLVCLISSNLGTTLCWCERCISFHVLVVLKLRMFRYLQGRRLRLRGEL